MWTISYNLYCVGGDIKHCSIQSSLVLLAIQQAFASIDVLPDTDVAERCLQVGLLIGACLSAVNFI